MKLRLLSVVLCVLVGCVLADPFPGWAVGANLYKIGIARYSAAGFSFTANITDEVKAPDETPVLKLVMGEVGPDAKTWSRQLLCDSAKKCPLGSTITVTFWAKASADIEFNLQLAQHEPPYKTLAKEASKMQKVGTEWKKLTLTAKVTLDGVQRPVLPRLMVGLVPEGTVIYVSQFDVEVKE